MTHILIVILLLAGFFSSFVIFLKGVQLVLFNFDIEDVVFGVIFSTLFGAISFSCMAELVSRI